MSLNSHNITSIIKDDEIDPRFYSLPNPEKDNIEICHEFFDNMEEISENINFRTITNISLNRKNESQNEVNETQNELKETQNEIYNEQNWWNEQNGTYNEQEQNGV